MGSWNLLAQVVPRRIASDAQARVPSESSTHRESRTERQIRSRRGQRCKRIRRPPCIPSPLARSIGRDSTEPLHSRRGELQPGPSTAIHAIQDEERWPVRPHSPSRLERDPRVDEIASPWSNPARAGVCVAVLLVDGSLRDLHSRSVRPDTAASAIRRAVIVVRRRVPVELRAAAVVIVPSVHHRVLLLGAVLVAVSAAVAPADPRPRRSQEEDGHQQPDQHTSRSLGGGTQGIDDHVVRRFADPGWSPMLRQAPSTDDS